MSKTEERCVIIHFPLLFDSPPICYYNLSTTYLPVDIPYKYGTRILLCKIRVSLIIRIIADLVKSLGGALTLPFGFLRVDCNS